MPRGAFYTVVSLGAKQSLTPEGFLLCEEVPLARTGEMLYGPGELPGDIPVGADGIVHVLRDPDEVFRPEFVTSFAGKPLVDDHPSSDVTPENWASHAKGTVLNPRRGLGAQDDVLLGDIIIYDPAVIQAVRTKAKREVSCGYDAEYEVDEGRPGYARQFSMVGNHVALVDSGRCGPRCAIGDRNIVQGDDMTTMSGKVRDKKYTWLDRIMAAFKAKDEEKLKEALDAAEEEFEKKEKKAEDAGGEENLHLHVDTGMAHSSLDAESEGRLGAIESKLEEHGAMHKEIKDGIEAINNHLGIGGGGAADEAILGGELRAEAPPGTSDEDIKKTKDSALLVDSFQDTVAGAEVLVPGIRVGTYDRAATPKKTLDAVTALRKTALELANNTPEGRAMLEALNGNRPLAFATMDCGAMRTLFRSAVAFKKTVNNGARDNTAATPAGGGLGIKGAAVTPADLNKLNAEHYAKKKAA